MRAIHGHREPNAPPNGMFRVKTADIEERRRSQRILRGKITAYILSNGDQKIYTLPPGFDRREPACIIYSLKMVLLLFVLYHALPL
jgi:hypothetical protein